MSLLANQLIITFANCICGSSSFGRAIAFQAIGGRFEPGLPLFFQFAVCSSQFAVVKAAIANCQLITAN